jgi:predicted metal-dependent peptidase
MSSKSARGFADSVTRRLEALEKNLMPIDDSSAASMNELLDGLAAGTAPTTPKPKKAKAADPELEKLLEAYAKYKMQSQNKDEKEKIEEIIL